MQVSANECFSVLLSAIEYKLDFRFLGLQCCSVNKRRHRDQSRSLSLARSDRVPFGPTSPDCGGLLQLSDVFPSPVGAGKGGMVREAAQMLLLLTNL